MKFDFSMFPSLMNPDFIDEQLIDAVFVRDEKREKLWHLFMFTRMEAIFYNQIMNDEEVYKKTRLIYEPKKFKWQKYISIAISEFEKRYDGTRPIENLEEKREDVIIFRDKLGIPFGWKLESFEKY